MCVCLKPQIRESMVVEGSKLFTQTDFISCFISSFHLLILWRNWLISNICAIYSIELLNWWITKSAQGNHCFWARFTKVWTSVLLRWVESCLKIDSRFYCITYDLDDCIVAFVSRLFTFFFCCSHKMEKSGNPPPYGWGNGHSLQPPPAAPPSYSQAVGGVGPSSPYTPQYPPSKFAMILSSLHYIQCQLYWRFTKRFTLCHICKCSYFIKASCKYSFESYTRNSKMLL